MNTFKCIVQLFIVKLVEVCTSHTKDCTDQCLFVLIQKNSVFQQHSKEDGLAKSILSKLGVLFGIFIDLTGFHACNGRSLISLVSTLHSFPIDLVLKPQLIHVCDIIKEAVTVDREVVDDLLDDWLHLQEGKDSASDVLIHDFQDAAEELLGLNAVSFPVIKERGENTDVSQGHVFDKVLDDVGELCASQVTSLVDIDSICKLANAQFLVLDAVCNLAKESEYQLRVRDVALGLKNALAHLLFHAA